MNYEFILPDDFNNEFCDVSPMIYHNDSDYYIEPSFKYENDHAVFKFVVWKDNKQFSTLTDACNYIRDQLK